MCPLLSLLLFPVVKASPNPRTKPTAPILVVGFVTDRALAVVSRSGSVGTQGVSKIMIGITVSSLVITDCHHQVTQTCIRF